MFDADPLTYFNNDQNKIIIVQNYMNKDLKSS